MTKEIMNKASKLLKDINYYDSIISQLDCLIDSEDNFNDYSIGIRSCDSFPWQKLPCKAGERLKEMLIKLKKDYEYERNQCQEEFNEL